MTFYFGYFDELINGVYSESIDSFSINEKKGQPREWCLRTLQSTPLEISHTYPKVLYNCRSSLQNSLFKVSISNLVTFSLISFIMLESFEKLHKSQEAEQVRWRMLIRQWECNGHVEQKLRECCLIVDSLIARLRSNVQSKDWFVCVVYVCVWKEKSIDIINS